MDIKRVRGIQGNKTNTRTRGIQGDRRKRVIVYKEKKKRIKGIQGEQGVAFLCDF